MPMLKERELLVFKQVASGSTWREIMKHSQLTKSQVSWAVSTITEKLKAWNSYQVAYLLYKDGHLPLPDLNEKYSKQEQEKLKNYISPAEVETFRLLAVEGYAVIDLAEHFKISERGVKARREAVMHKLGVPRAIAAVGYLLALGLLE